MHKTLAPRKWDFSFHVLAFIMWGNSSDVENYHLMAVEGTK